MKASRPEGEHSLAVFIDFENVGLGFGGRRDRFEIQKVLERIVEKGKIVAKKAYADWSRFSEYSRSLHEAAIELIEIPRRNQTGKNSADIRLVVDAIDLAYSKDHIDTFVIVSGDSDFSPLVSKLKELGKHVIGLGLADATSVLLRDNCDEFIYYEDLGRAPIGPVAVNDEVPEQKRKVFNLLLDSLLALRRENKELIFSSMVKETMKRKKPSFNEGYYGYRTFSELLEDAQKEGLLDLDRHKASGTYIVARFGSEPKGGPLANGREAGPVSPAEPRATPAPERTGGRGRSGSGRGRAAASPADREARAPAAAPRAIDATSRVVEPPVPRPPIAARPPVAAPPTDDAYEAAAERPLGRALMDELDEDPIDEIPSYRPGKSATPALVPAAPKPAAATTRRPTAAKPAAAPARRPAAKKEDAAPRVGKAPSERPEKAPPRRTAAVKSAGGATPGPAAAASPPAAPKPAVTAAPPAAPKPAARPIDDDGGFGDGLDV